ncbi:MAG: hypothetical protein ACRD2W_03420 [Acidimicrobiales bacterium]
MEPNVQLCLTSDDLPAPPPLLIEALPEEAVAAALDRLGRLMVRAARPSPAIHTGEGGDDE